MDTPTFALFCNPESRRVEGFSNAVSRSLREVPTRVPWSMVMERRNWEPLLEPLPRFLRLESPGKHWRVEKQLLVTGAEVHDEESPHAWRRLTRVAIAQLENDPGRILPQRQWFLGWREVLGELGEWAGKRGLADRWLCPPEDVVRMFDKAECQRLLECAGIPVSPALGIPKCFDDLWEQMRRTGCRRVFLKPCHGSSASGVVALEASGPNVQAFTTVEIVEAQDGLRLYNQRRVQTCRGAQVRRLVDAICAERCLAQVWVPKAGLHQCAFDVRVVIIGNRARQVMVRLGHGPITNSQLLGGRGDPLLLRRRMGEEAWAGMLATCERAMAACFPRSLYAGLDVLVETNYRKVRILEVNAFGDLLPRLLHEGLDTYAWEVMEALRRGQPSQVSAAGA